MPILCRSISEIPRSRRLDTYGLVLKDGCKVPDDVDNPENKPILGSHGQVRSVSVARHWRLVGDSCEQFMHSGRRTDLRRSCVDCEDEDEDDSEEDAGVRAMRDEVSSREPMRLELSHLLVAE